VHIQNEQKIMQDLLTCTDDSTKQRGFRESSKHTSEKKRISLLVNKYTSVNSKLDSLKSFVTNYFWRSRRRVLTFIITFTRLELYISSIPRLPTEKFNLLAAVIDDLIDVLPSVLSSFSLPP